jgi:hypothetical protein
MQTPHWPVARYTVLASVVLASASLACSRAAEPPKVPLAQATVASADTGVRDALPPAARVALDSGNLEFRAGRYDAALVQYRRAANVLPEDSAPLYGIYMVAKKVGNAPLADSVSAKISGITHP